jgi:hypothetical protein
MKLIDRKPCEICDQTIDITDRGEEFGHTPDCSERSALTEPDPAPAPRQHAATIPGARVEPITKPDAPRPDEKNP